VNLEALYLVHNQIRVVENLSALVNLRVLELGDNRIKVCLISMNSSNDLILFLEN
jgi:Leucine-rich repeat (LRR) protein